MPTYEYECAECGVFEEMHSITTKLEHCPKCKENGCESSVKRLISLSGRGVVELTGDEITAKIKSDTQKLKQDMKNEKTYANMLGESKYQSLQQRMDKARGDKRNR